MLFLRNIETQTISICQTDKQMNGICFMTTVHTSCQQSHWTCTSTCLFVEYTFLCPSQPTTLNHDNVRHWYNISNVTLLSDRGDQELSNGVKHIKIGPLLTMLEANSLICYQLAHLRKLTNRCNLISEIIIPCQGGVNQSDREQLVYIYCTVEVKMCELQQWLVIRNRCKIQSRDLGTRVYCTGK